ncbi:membrane transporter [Schizosaccharomyces japonicus yFS275]|uniref:Membrane transporter n=1 Tax=Schizosaccharomyces japonicus (strain yFS275 / FY16936) TaxID=402676 RepID=B6K129_SCHJY|nr:membrane transporter [Schizosaccharomyces japonicus yFS275]EEB07650.1 membrane transporter [Schizosaccharomyces japonicus yFS275]
MHILVLARIMQGISASIVWCVGLALVLDAVGPRNVGFTVGGIFGFTSVGEVISPVLGGLIYDSFGYYWAFSTCFVLLIIDIILRCLVLEPREAKKKLSQEEEEHVPILQRQNDFDLETTGKLSAWNSVFLPIYRLTFHRKVCGPYWTSFVNSVLLASFDATVPLELKRLFNFTSAQCGLTFGVLSAPYFFCGPLAGKMVDRRGSKTIGFYAYLALSFTLFLLLIPSSRTTANVVIFIAAMALNGYILAFTSSPGFVQLTAYVTEYEKTHPTFFGPSGPYTQIFSVMNVVYSFGMILGPIIAGYLRIHFGFPATVIFLSLMMLSASLVSYYCFTDNDSEEEE